MRSYQGECHREGEEVPGDDGQEDGARDGERLEEEVSHEHAAEDLQETDINHSGEHSRFRIRVPEVQWGSFIESGHAAFLFTSQSKGPLLAYQN